MQIPILNGVYTDQVADFRTSYPRNMIPVPKQNGISQGYLRPADGIVEIGTGPGADRGGINWNGVCYRVMGSSLVRVDADNTITIIGDVGNGGVTAKMDYSFDRLAIVSGGKLFYYDNITLTQVSDPDLGSGITDVIFVDGYFFLTDGTSTVVTDLSDPLSINPLKYGSAEADPDPVQQLIKVRNEPFVVGRYTIEVFNNVGGNLFPFQRVPGALVARGSVSKRSAAFFMEAVAMVGGGRNEPLAVWMALNGQSTKISTREIDQILQQYTDAELQDCVVESRTDKHHRLLLIHLPDQTLVYDAAGSAAVQEPVWFTLDSGIGSPARYRARNLVWCYNKWIVGDPTTFKLGTYVDNVSTHYGSRIGWEFGTMVIYNEGRGAIIHELELVTLSGRVADVDEPVVWTSYSLDGVTWSQEYPKTAGTIGRRNIRISWLQQGTMRQWRVQKFRGVSDAFLSITRLEARMEGLNV